MNRKLLFFFTFFFCYVVQAQEDAWVYFNDKPDAAFYLSNPLQMLSQRALDRRTTQGILLNDTDVPISQTYIDEVTNTTGITVMAKSKWLNALHIRGSQSDIQTLTNLTFVNRVEFADRTLNSRTAPTNRVREIQNVNKQLEVLVDYNYGGSSNQIQMLNGHLLHQQNYTGQGKIIAVMDAGFPGVDTASPFQRLRDNNLILGGYNFPDRNTSFYTRGSHGTNVLSCMGGYVDNQLVGTAPDAQYYLFITEDINSENPVEESYWVEAAEMADSLGVDVINTSLGYFEYDIPNYSYSYADMNGTKTFISRGADMAFSKGMICVTSAGNSGATSEPHIATPADAITTLTIGAVNATEDYVSFSSIGPSFDGRVKPDVCAKGLSATVSNTAGAIVNANGTSFSSPIMAGMVTSFWSAVPNMTNAEVVQFVKQSADLYANPTIFKGYGVPDFQLALSNALSLNSNEIASVVLYPNPVKDKILVSLPNDGTSAKLTLYNNIGQQVNSYVINETNSTIYLESLASGLYFYQVEFANKTAKGKLLKL
ncbi:S8 family serine peptidase [Flavobacterium channae]|uniref:S8 family serine peptidase n=1 Tax=Flavobacterium channae TaxID=2897181 RepID=UPI001E5A88D2|nr:S8 family serine peptidase [Flavobacterium channae]UGS24561.1 S8 family serine peptidase [Flavobacterium channae]